MNTLRREDIDATAYLLEEVKGRIEEIGSEENEYFESIPENLQSSTKAERAEEVVSELEDLESEIDDLVTRLKNCKYD